MKGLQFLAAVAAMAQQAFNRGQSPSPVPAGNASKGPLWSGAGIVSSGRINGVNQRQRRKRARQVGHRWT
jgi:hypothetical protein